jgi:DNA processing protein
MTLGANYAFEVREPLPGEGDARILLALGIACLGALRPAERAKLFRRLDRIEDLAVLSRLDVEMAVGRIVQRAELDPASAAREAEAFYPVARKRGIRIIAIDDPAYPPILREIADPPFALFVRGALPEHDEPSLAIVGTRNPDMGAYAATRSLAKELAFASVPVVSGLAFGIDRAAHEGALEGKGRTVAVLGCGIDAVYPRAHSSLAARIIATGGALVSEYPPGREPLKHRFPERNRIVSGLSRSVVVAQAPAHSGALITADFALEQGRDLMVLAAGLRGERGAGTAALAEEGAAVVESAADIARAWRGWENE